MKKLFLLLGFVSVFVSKSHAQVWDSSFDFGARSFPLGAAFGIMGGYGVPIWGDTSDIKYGYTRIGGRVQTSGVVHRLDAQLAVFPISFLGVELKSGWGHRSLDEISTLDCISLQCSGAVTRTSLGAPLYFGTGALFGRAKLEYTWIAATQITDRDLADESTNLTVHSSGDELRRWELLAGVKWREDLRTMVFWDTYKAQHTSQSNRNFGVIAQKNFDQHALYAGAAIYESSTAAAHLQLLAAYVFSFQKGLGF